MREEIFEGLWDNPDACSGCLSARGCWQQPSCTRCPAPAVTGAHFPALLQHSAKGQGEATMLSMLWAVLPLVAISSASLVNEVLRCKTGAEMSREGEEQGGRTLF